MKKNTVYSPKTKDSAIEYAVYIHHPANQNKQFWERMSITSSAELALEQAELLHFSQKYPKIEVKRKFFCRRRKQTVSETLKIFETPKDGVLGLFSRILSWLKAYF